MSFRVVFRPEARADLIGLYDHVAAASGHQRAAHFLRRIQENCLSLTTFPHRGTARDDLAPGLRQFGIERRVSILFRVLETEVEIVAMAYAGRDLERLFGERGA